MDIKKLRHFKLLISAVLIFIVSFVFVTNFYIYDGFGFTKNGTLHTYYGTKLKMPDSAYDITEYSDRSGFLADGTEVLTFKVSRDDAEKLLYSFPFDRTDQWQKGPFPKGCLQGFLNPCSSEVKNIFRNPASHITVENDDNLYFAEIDEDNYIVIVLDMNELRVLVYKYVR